jgi:hypothetical protein
MLPTRFTHLQSSINKRRRLATSTVFAGWDVEREGERVGERMETREDRDVLMGMDPKLRVCPFLGQHMVRLVRPCMQWVGNVSASGGSFCLFFTVGLSPELVVKIILTIRLDKNGGDILSSTVCTG